MVTWTKAFMSALKIIAYSIGFWIIGAVLIGFGAIQSSLSVYYNPRSPYTNMIIGIISIIIGALIIFLGGLASILKVMTELITEETVKELRKQP